MADVTIPARAGEPVDAVLDRVFGRTDGLLAVLAANPGLAATDRLAEGQLITVPATATAAPASQLFDLWD